MEKPAFGVLMFRIVGGFLTTDLAKKNVPENNWIDRLYGAFVSDKSAEEMVNEIRASRRFDRNSKSAYSIFAAWKNRHLAF
jgi:hypothetical protein